VSVLLALLATVAVNALANTLPLGGRTTGEISDSFAILFVPAGYVFSIWGVIYAGLLGYAIYQALPSQRGNLRLARSGYLFVLSSLANVAWLFAWHFGYTPLSLLVMLVLLSLLITIYLRLEIGRRQVSRAESLLVRLPFSLYLGWITVATVANASAALYSLGWDGLGLTPQTWALIMLFVAAAIGGIVSLTRRDLAFNLVLVWAFTGIAVKQQGVPAVATGALLAAMLVVVMLLAAFLVRPGARPSLAP
jgi:hypothetical protein